jgi:hypothetical protein
VPASDHRRIGADLLREDHDEVVGFKPEPPVHIAFHLREGKSVLRFRGNNVWLADDSGSHKDPASAESQAAQKLSARPAWQREANAFLESVAQQGAFAKKNGQPVKVLFGALNFSFRGISIQANKAFSR